METATAEPEVDEATEQQQEEATDSTPAAPTASELEHEWTLEIRAAQEKCDKLDLVRAAAESDAKRAKKNHEAAVDSLQELIRRGPSAQLPLDFKDKSQPEQTDEEKRHAYLMTRPIIDALDLTDKQEEKLADAGVKTVGDFEKLRAGEMPDYPGGLKDLPRVGEATIDKWEDELMNWLEAESYELEGDDSTFADEVADEFARKGLLAQ